MSVNSGMWEPFRNLSARVRLTLATGAEAEGEALSFTVDEGADSPLLPGAVLSAKYSLELANDEGQWRWGGSLRGERPLVGATARLFVEVGGAEIPCGVFVVDSVSADEGSGRVRLSGSDSIASELAYAFEDSLAYPATLDALWRHWLGQTRYVWSGALSNGDQVIPRKPDWRGATLRKAAGWIAQAAGCFVQVDRTGSLAVRSCQGGDAVELSADDYLSLSDGFDAFGPVHEARITPEGGEEPVIFSDGDGAAVSVEGNPLFMADNAQSLGQAFLGQISGLRLTRAEFRWRGDPALGVGDRVILTDTAGTRLECMVTGQKLKFDQGFSADCACEVPDAGDGGVLRAITPEGGVNAGALVGAVNGGLLRAQSVTAEKIAAAAITADKLAANSVTAEKVAAGAVTAEKLAVGSVTADKLEADSVSGQVARFLEAEIGKITAESLETDSLYAAFARLISLAADSISAGRLDADQLAAQLARVVTLYAGTGEFDFATIRNLVARAMALEQGSMDTVYIRNLAVTSANMLSATLGKLVIKGEDGKYYRVFVGATGEISAEEVTVTDGEVIAGETSAGRQIVETTMNVGSLNATTIQGSSAVINDILTIALNADKITAADALIASATIPALYAASIKAIGDHLDLSANESVKIMVGRKNRIFRSEAPPGEAQKDDLWVQPSTGYIFQKTGDGTELPELATDDEGNLYYRYSDGQTVYDLYLDEGGDLYISADARFSITISEDGVPLVWERVKDSELAGAIVDAETGLEEKINGSVSELTQRADSLELAISKKVDGDVLRTYMRYGDGVLELGRSDSRYTTQTSDSGFKVLQDGAVMTSVEQNTVSAPVINARRMYAIGDHSIYIGSTGHLIFN